MNKRVSIIFFLAASSAAFAGLCNDGGYITGYGEDTSDTQASYKAYRDIASRIDGKMGVTIDEQKTKVKEETETATGTEVDTSSYYKKRDSLEENFRMELYIEQTSYIQLENGYPMKDENGKLIYKLYACKSDIANNKLELLKGLRNDLLKHAQDINRDLCALTVHNIRSDINRHENSLMHFGGSIDRALKKEYDGYLEEITQKCEESAKRSSSKTGISIPAVKHPDLPEDIAAEITNAIRRQVLSEFKTRADKYGVYDDYVNDRYVIKGSFSGSRVFMLDAIDKSNGDERIDEKIIKTFDMDTLLQKIHDSIPSLCRSIYENSDKAAQERKIYRKDGLRWGNDKYFSRTIPSIAAGTIGIAAIAYGISKNSDVKDLSKKEKFSEADKAKSLRDLLYMGGGLLLGGGIAVGIGTEIYIGIKF